MMDQIQNSIAMSTIIRRLATEAHMDNNHGMSNRLHAALDQLDDEALAAIWTRLTMDAHRSAGDVR